MFSERIQLVKVGIGPGIQRRFEFNKDKKVKDLLRAISDDTHIPMDESDWYIMAEGNVLLSKSVLH